MENISNILISYMPQFSLGFSSDVTAGIAFAIWFISLGVVIFGNWKTFQHLEKPSPHMDAPFGLYPISILKPVKGAEDGIERNLESYFKLDYPRFEILFSVADPSDPCVPIIQKLRERYPNVDTRLLTGDVEAGFNPKVNNLIKSYGLAKYDWLYISDSNTLANKDCLRNLASHLDSNIGVLTSVVVGRDVKCMGGALEAAYLNTFFARWMVLTPMFGRPCVVGKSMMFRRSVANGFGGINTMAKYLAEDYMTGELMRQMGFKVVVSNQPVIQPIGKYSIEAFWKRHLRWGRIRKAHAIVPFLVEPLFSMFVSGVLGALAAKYFFHTAPEIFFLLHTMAWGASDLMLLERLEPNAGPRLWLGWFLRELIAVPLWANAALGNTVQWRGLRLRIGRGGVLTEVYDNSYV